MPKKFLLLVVLKLLHMCVAVTVPFIFGRPLHTHLTFWIPSSLCTYIHINGNTFEFCDLLLGSPNISNLSCESSCLYSDSFFLSSQFSLYCRYFIVSVGFTWSCAISYRIIVCVISLLSYSMVDTGGRSYLVAL